MKMHLKIIYAIINLSLLIISCSPQKEPDIQGLSVIGWGDLQLTPKPNDHLCPEIAYDELEWEHSKRDFSYGLFGAIYPEHISGAGNQADRTAWINATVL